jgi:hypothetical protein
MYGTATASDNYHADRGNSAWAAATAANRLIARQRGTDYVDRSFRNRFPGLRTSDHTQIEEWPRTGATYYRTGESISSSVVPVEIENATYEAALRELATPGILLPDYTPSKQVTQQTVGPITTKFAVAGAPSDAVPVVTQIAGILSGILRPLYVPGGLAV